MYVPRHRARVHVNRDAALQLLASAALVLAFTLAAGLLFFSR